jgi:hypothetical protein
MRRSSSPPQARHHALAHIGELPHLLAEPAHQPAQAGDRRAREPRQRQLGGELEQHLLHHGCEQLSKVFRIERASEPGEAQPPAALHQLAQHALAGWREHVA